MPKKPVCSLCPLSGECKAEVKGNAGNLPNRVPKKKKPTRVGTIFWLSNDKGEILLRRRPEKGLLGGMVELPSSDWQENSLTQKKTFFDAPEKIIWKILPGRVRHTFTHFHLELEIATGQCIKPELIKGIWSNASDFGNYALPTVMKKVVAHALKYKD